MSNRPNRMFLSPVSALGCLALAAAALAASPARADVEWHADLETARSAARISRRPVLAVFVASWGADARVVEETCLRSPEAEAVLATCFEPVRIDIDANPELTRQAGVTHVPTACVLAADNSPVASFEMPDSPTGFVTAAILAAQRAADDHDIVPTAAEERVGEPPAPEPAPHTSAAVFGSTSDAAIVVSRPPRGSIARVTAKVRDLSAFARAGSLPAPEARPVTIAQASRAVTGTPDVPAPVSWPAEPAAGPPTAVAPAPPPATAGATLTPTPVAPWLGAAPAQQVQPPAAAAPVLEPASTVSATAPLPSTTPPAAPSEPRQSGLIAALQKPFGLGPKMADPPTMPPAQPQSPLTATPPAPPAAEATPDTLGSMPVGLEGYCPVTLVDRGAWTEGRAQWGARHRGRTYLFAGPDEQRTFLSNPDRYAPALSGDDPVLALDRGSSTPGQRRYGVTYQARMYLFATPETRQAFTADPGRYASRIAVAERGQPAAAPTRTY